MNLTTLNFSYLARQAPSIKLCQNHKYLTFSAR